MKRMAKAATEISGPPNAGVRRGSDHSMETLSEHPPQRFAEPAGTPALVRRGPVPLEIRKLAQQMLAEGASPEEVVAASRARGVGRITEATVKHWLTRNPKLRERALKRQIEAVKLLGKTLEEGGGPAKARLADAARFAGLAQSAQGRSRLDLPKLVELHSSMWDSLQRENVALKHRALKLEAEKVSISRRIEAIRMRVDRMRWQVVQQQLDRLWDAVSGSGAPGHQPRPLSDLLRSLYRAAGRTPGTRDRGPGAGSGSRQ